MTTATFRLKAVCPDRRAPAMPAPFCAAALGYPMRPHSAADLANLAAMGHTAETDPAVALDPPDGAAGPTFWLNEAPEPKAGKNRAHVDVYLDGETVDPLLALGVTVLREPGDDPFCASRRTGR